MDDLNGEQQEFQFRYCFLQTILVAVHQSITMFFDVEANIIPAASVGINNWKYDHFDVANLCLWQRNIELALLQLNVT